MIIETFTSGPLATNTYVVACPTTRAAVIIDPSQNSTPSIIQFLEKNHLKAEKIWLTHSHWDHIADVFTFKTYAPIPVLIHQEDAANLENPGSDGLPLWIKITGIHPDGFLSDGDTLHIGNLSFTVIHTPGHSPGSLCFYCQAEKILISGDTLFKGSIGNLSFPTATPTLMWKSLTKLASLPPETRVFPGHGPNTTIKAENWLSEAERIFGH